MDRVGVQSVGGGEIRQNTSVFVKNSYQKDERGQWWCGSQGRRGIVYWYVRRQRLWEWQGVETSRVKDMARQQAYREEGRS